MPRINNLPDDTVISNNDKLIGTDSQTGASRNYKIGDLRAFIRKGTIFTHHQNTASNTWTINHNTESFPSVSLKFSSSDKIYENVGAYAGVQYNDNNTITITLAAAESGYAYLN
jgi:hypothetical protein|tara:strand:- start:14335 stop:14676 length:342 start_codon:yes stop_codon:yes gene_type:complete